MAHPGWQDITGTGIATHPPPLLTQKEVQRQLNISRSTLTKLRQEKSLTAIKIGETWRFRQADVDRYLADRQNTREE